MLLEQGNAVNVLPEVLKAPLLALASIKFDEHTAGNLQSKFKQTLGGFELVRDARQIFGGLERLVGTPDINILGGMAEEHAKKLDSHERFQTKNYLLETTPFIEWHFVAEPNDEYGDFVQEEIGDQVALGDMEKARNTLGLGKNEWPREKKMASDILGLSWERLETAPSGSLYASPALSEAIANKPISQSDRVKWKKIDKIPTSGIQLKHQALVEALKFKESDTAEFEQTEWAKLDVGQLRANHYVVSSDDEDNAYFVPVSMRLIKFTETEWEAIGIKDLLMSHYLQVGDAYFRPEQESMGHRKPMPLKQFQETRTEMNEELKKTGDKVEVGIEELFGARLYTGPLFEKYNGVLRGLNVQEGLEWSNEQKQAMGDAWPPFLLRGDLMKTLGDMYPKPDRQWRLAPNGPRVTANRQWAPL